MASDFDFDTAFAEAAGTRTAYRRGASGTDAVMSGIAAGNRLAAERKDPLLFLHELQVQSKINESGAQAASHIRGLALRDRQLKDEQADENTIAEIVTDATLNPHAKLEKLSSVYAKSPTGISNLTRLRLSLSELIQQDSISRTISKLTPRQQARLRGLETGSDEWWSSVETITAQDQAAKQFSSGPIATAYENSRTAEAAGNLDEAQIHRDYAAKLAGHSIKTDEQIAQKATASKISTLTTEMRGLETKYDSANADYKKIVKTSPGTAVDPESPEAAGARAKAEYFLRQKNAKQKQIDALVNPSSAATNSPAASAPDNAQKVMTPGIAVRYLEAHGGDRTEAEAAAKKDGYSW